MNSYSQATTLGLIGTDARIVEQLQACGVTDRPISLDELLYALNMRGMLVKLAIPGEGNEKWTGSIMSLIAAVNSVGTDQQKMGLSIWFSHITNPRNSHWTTTEPAHAAPFWQLYLAFGDQPGMPTKADFEAIAQLGGGWLFSDLTVEQFAADKLAVESAEQHATLRARVTNATALFSERMTAESNPGEVMTQAWEDAV